MAQVEPSRIPSSAREHHGSRTWSPDPDASRRRPVVYVIEDGWRGDELSMLREAGVQAHSFEAAAFLHAAPVLVGGCVLANCERCHPGAVALQLELKTRDLVFPLIALGDEGAGLSAAIEAMKAGVADFLARPFNRDQLLKTVHATLESLHSTVERGHARARAGARVERLSTRERQVLQGLLGGGTNKVIARILAISPRTVEIHRARLMDRLNANSLPEALSMAAAAGLEAAPTRANTPRWGC